MVYTKNHDPWTIVHLLTGRAFNRLETQWDEFKVDADVHNHDTRYYTKTLADSTFFSTTFNTGFDADKIDGLNYPELLSDSLPIGAIVYWATSSTIPTGWHKCDGAGGTPNLQDKFIVGAGSTFPVAGTGGSFTAANTASIAVGNHAITAGEMPIHTHAYRDDHNTSKRTEPLNSPITATAGPITDISPNPTTGATGSGGAHGHTGSTITMNALNATPPYYAMYLIMKVS